MIQQRNENQDDPSWGTVEDLKTKAAESDIGDITRFLGPVRAIAFYMEAGEGTVMLPLSVN